MNVGFSGTRSGLSENQKKSILKFFIHLSHRSHYRKIYLHHGDCIGADSDISELLVYESLINRLIIHPPTNLSLRAFVAEKIRDKANKSFNGLEIEILKDKDYLDRNREIVEVSDLIIICPKTEEEELRSGTWATYRAAKKLNKKIIIIYPSGRTETWPNKSFIKKIKKNLNKRNKINENGKPTTNNQSSIKSF